MQANYKNLLSKTSMLLIFVFLGVMEGKPATAQDVSAPLISPDTSTEVESSPEMESSPELESSPEVESSSLENSIVEVISQEEMLATLTKALEKAELTEILSEEGSYTLLAPSNDAFARLPEGSLELLLRPENQELLKQVLLYHVIEEKISSEEMKTGELKTLAGELSVQVNTDEVLVNEANVIQVDIEADNGIIHLIDQVLIPSQVLAQLEQAVQPEETTSESAETAETAETANE